MGDKNFELRKLNQKCDEALKINDFGQAIVCYEKMFELTKDYHYKIKVANIHYKVYRNIAKAAEIYKEATPHLSKESMFWWQNFEIQANMNRTYDAVTGIYNAIKIEINGVKLENNA